MNPIMKGLNQPAQPQQGIASLAPTPPTQATPPTQGIHNQEFIDPGVGKFNPPSSAFPDPSAPPINLFPSQPPGYQPPGVQPGTGAFDHLTDNPSAAGPPDDFVTMAGPGGQMMRYYTDGRVEKAPANWDSIPPLTQTAPPQTNYSPGVMPPGWQNVQPFDPNQGNLGIFPGGNPGFDESSNNPYGINQGIASLAGTNPGI